MTETTVAWQGSERRASFRVPMSAGAHLDDDRRASTLNISLGGVALLSPVPAAVDQMLPLRLGLEPGPVVVHGRVRHCTRTANGFVVGCQFVGLDAAGERRVAAAVAVQDRRTSLRAAVAVALEYRRRGTHDPYRLTASTDISVGGIRFGLVSPLQLGDRLEMILMVESDRIPMEAIVIRVDHQDDQWHAAATFDEARSARIADLRAAVRRYLDTYPHVVD